MELVLYTKIKRTYSVLCIVWESIRETSSHATRQGTLVHCRLRALSHCRLILALKVNVVRVSYLLQKQKYAEGNQCADGK